MRPLDPRLLRYARGARWYLVVGAVLGVASTACTVAFAWALSRLVVDAVEGRFATELAGTAGFLIAVLLVRAAVSWASDTVAALGAARVKSELRQAVVARVAERGPAWLSGRSTADLGTLLGRGLDALDDYFARYLPQLILTVIATPVIVIVIWSQDMLSGIFVLVTLPVIPLFMVLIGLATRTAQRAQWEGLQRLSRNFLDVLGGLSTLKAYGRAERQRQRVRALAGEYRQRTMKVLRVSFISGFALELLASLAVALVAVTIGFRLMDGTLALSIGLFVLLLAPEAFLPLRQVGTNFHAAAEGVEAAEDCFRILDPVADEPAVPARVAGETAPPPGGPSPAAGLHVRGLRAGYGDRVVLDELSFAAQPGRITAVTGPSGCGKSTLFSALLGFLPAEGQIVLGGRPLNRDRIAWAGQKPGLTAGTLAENIALGSGTEPDRAAVRSALDALGLQALDPERNLGPGGRGLSGGQAQRVALARAVYRAQAAEPGMLVLADEPSSALDGPHEALVLAALRTLAESGAVVLVISHRPAVVAAADDVVALVPPAEPILAPATTAVRGSTS